MPEASAVLLQPHPEAETRSGAWVLIMADEEDGYHWTFQDREGLEAWLRSALETLQDG